MLASNPLRNSRPELIADDGQGALLPARPIAWTGPEGCGAEAAAILTPGARSLAAQAHGREGGTPVQVYQKERHIGPIDSACLKKRI